MPKGLHLKTNDMVRFNDVFQTLLYVNGYRHSCDAWTVRGVQMRAGSVNLLLLEPRAAAGAYITVAADANIFHARQQ